MGKCFIGFVVTWFHLFMQGVLSFGSPWINNRELHKLSAKDAVQYPHLCEIWTNRRRRNEEIVKGRGGDVDAETLARATRVSIAMLAFASSLCAR